MVILVRSAGRLIRVWKEMADPRNVAHDKKVKQEKAHQAAKTDDAKPKKRRKGAAASPDGNETTAAAQAVQVEQAPGELEKSVAVLSKLKEMEHYSRANIETLAGLTLTIDDELKQKEFVDPIGALYSAQDGFQTQTAALVASYEAKCESLKPSA
ncbi:MAG TPA: hypothetical protein VK993_00070 [Chthoniobacterales bacterium]|nr:hypothetical protein [Chthoniobacterales bacterium]